MYNRQLDTFIQAADSGSFSKAAETLHISPTAVIKQINLLESGLGLRLFVRTHQGIALTEAGKSLYKDTKYIILYSKESAERARKAMMLNENTIRIGTSMMTPSKFLMDQWSKIQAFCPELKIQLIPFENTPENAREILMNLGRNIDVIAGIFDENYPEERGCATLELSRAPICCALSIQHRLASKDRLNVQDLFGEKLMLMRRGWNRYVDMLRDDMWQHYPQITIEDFSFYDVHAFNQCENGNRLLMAVGSWENVHPLLKIVPVEWEHAIPFGLLYAPQPSVQVLAFINAVAEVFGIKA